MKARNREINIFNLSMMDVISGAMAAFLILVVILSRDYNPSDAQTTKAIQRLQKELLETTGQLDDASRQIDAGSSDPTAIERNLIAARNNVREATSHLAQLAKQLQQANAEVTRLRNEFSAQKKRADDLQNQMDGMRPYAVLVLWRCENSGNTPPKTSPVSIFLYDSLANVNGKNMPLFQPGSTQPAFYRGDALMTLYLPASGTESWITRDVVVGEKLKLYYTLTSAARPQCWVWGTIQSSYFKAIDLPVQTLDATKRWVFVGVLTVDKDYTIAFAPATKEQQAQEEAAVAERLHADKQKRDK